MKGNELLFRALKILSITILLAFALSNSFSCKKQSEKPKKIEQEQYLSSGYSDKYNPFDPKDVDKLQSRYRIKSGDAFKGTYGIENHQSKKNTYHVVALLDYKQIPLVLDGKQSLTHKMTIDKFKLKLAKFKTPSIGEGFHDYSMILFENLENHKTDSSFRLSTMNYFQAINSNLIAGKSKKRDFPKTFFSRKGFKTKVTGGPILSDKEAEAPIWMKSKVKEGKEVKYYIHMSNDTKFEKNYAFTAFLGAKQIDIQGNNVIFTSIEPDTRMVIPASIKFGAKDKGKTYELTVVSFGSPGLPLDDEKTQKLPGYDEQSLSSNRVALFVD